MDTTQARRAILSRLKAGEISEDQADAEIERLLNPPKRGRGRPKKPRFFVRDSNGEPVELRSRYRRKPSQRELTIGRHYVDQVEAGTKPMIAMRNTLKQFSTKHKPLEDSSVRRYAGLFKKWRQQQIEWRRQWLELSRITDPGQAVKSALEKINPARQLQEFLGARHRATIQSAQDVARRYIEELSRPHDSIQRQVEALEAEARERFQRASEAAQSLIRRGFEVGQKK